MKKILTSILAGLAILVLAISITTVAKATPPQHNQVRLCHHTEGNHYNDITVDDDAVFQQGHDQHQGGQDIIPPFSYQVWEVTGTHLECPPGGYIEYSNPTKCKKWKGTYWDYKDKVVVEDYGWVTHNYPGKNWDTAGQAIWNNSCQAPTPPPTDLCSNLEGTQETMPDGYCDPDQDKICTLIEQPEDVCPNLEGTQTEIPDGLVKDDQGNCVEPSEEEDVCPNIKGTQTEVPFDHILRNGICIKRTHGGGSSTIEPQVLGATTEVLPVGGADLNLYASLLAAIVLLFGSAAYFQFAPKIK